MSPDNYYTSPKATKLEVVARSLSISLPALSAYLVKRPQDCRGLTLFLGDGSDWVIGLRIFTDDGSPAVCWASGDDPIEAIYALEQRIKRDEFKPDKVKSR